MPNPPVPMRRRSFVALALGAAALPLLAQPALEGGGSEPDPAKDSRLAERTQVSQGVVSVHGKRIEYRAVAGLLQVDDSRDEPSAVMSYVAYFGKTEPGAAHRPVLFL